MLSLVKMAPSAWRYYAEEVATGREDYYALGAERRGVFLGRGAEALGIDSLIVDALALERLFGHGCDPRDGAPLGRSFSPTDERAVAGFALTFSPPKSVSVLWGVSPEETTTAVLAAQDAAVDAALSFLEEHAAFTRRGHGGILQVDTDGLVGAAFVHRTSRAADPQLHTHLLVANKVRAADGTWLALDARELFEVQKAAGLLYKAALRAELTARLGVAWSAVDDNGVAEILGVPAELIEHWSARRRAVEDTGRELVAAREAELGRRLGAKERAEAFQLAAYRTRAPKVDAETPTTELRARWQEEAMGLGHDPAAWLGEVLDRAELPVRDIQAEQVATVVARLEGRQSTWGRAQVVEEAARLVAGSGAREVRRSVELLADQALRDPEVISLAAPLPVAAPGSLRRRDEMAAFERHGGTRFTTQATLRREAEVLEAAAAGMSAGVAVVEEGLAEWALVAGRLGPDQSEAVRGLLRGGERIALLVGPAGSGKSHALATARAAWGAAGYSVVGLAPSAMAAQVLEEEAGMRSETLARFLARAEQLPPASVVVLDEAGMAATDDLAALVARIGAAGSKLVLVGDPHQLGAVGPGGLFRTLVEDHGAHELETVRRFAHGWEAAASLLLRARDPSALPSYLEYGRIQEGSRSAMLDAAFSSWRRAHDEDRALLVMAGDNATVEELSRRARAELVRRGEVEADGVRIAAGIAGVGDEVVTLRNDRRLRPEPDDFVRNGARWRVVECGEDGSLTVAARSGSGEVVLPPEYVAEHVALSYALTVHKAQGSTVDQAILLVDEKTTAEQLYVGMSRGREWNEAFVVTSEDGIDDHGRGASFDGISILAAAMRRDGVDRSAHEVLRRNLAQAESAEMARQLHAVMRDRIEEQAGPDLSDAIAALAARADDVAAREGLAAATRQLAAAEQALAAARKQVADADGSLRVHLPGRRGDEARQQRARATTSLERSARGVKHARSDVDAARAWVSESSSRRDELESLRLQQAKRSEYLSEHPEEVTFLDAVRKIAQHRGEFPSPMEDEDGNAHRIPLVAEAARPQEAQRHRQQIEAEPERWLIEEAMHAGIIDPWRIPLDAHELGIHELSEEQGPGGPNIRPL